VAVVPHLPHTGPNMECLSLGLGSHPGFKSQVYFLS
jgi:hypothetical protein